MAHLLSLLPLSVYHDALHLSQSPQVLRETAVTFSRAARSQQQVVVHPLVYSRSVLAVVELCALPKQRRR